MEEKPLSIKHSEPKIANKGNSTSDETKLDFGVSEAPFTWRFRNQTKSVETQQKQNYWWAL